MSVLTPREKAKNCPELADFCECGNPVYALGQCAACWEWAEEMEEEEHREDDQHAIDNHYAS